MMTRKPKRKKNGVEPLEPMCVSIRRSQRKRMEEVGRALGIDSYSQIHRMALEFFLERRGKLA